MTRALKVVAVLSVVAVCGAGQALAGNEGQSKKWKKGQGWEAFAKTFDGNSDGKVSKDEMLAKHPGFDLMDSNKDGVAAQDEVKAMPASTKQPNFQSFVAKFDQDKDGKVTMDEFNQGRGKAFDGMDKNSDGFIEQSEFTPDALKQLS